MTIELQPVAFVHNSRKEPSDDHWGTIISEVVLADHIPEEAFANISMFSHLEVIYYFHQLPAASIAYSRKPRGNPDYPVMGIFAQRNKDRPNSVGLCTVKLQEHKGRKLIVKHLDAVDGTPVIDIKPVFKEYHAKGKIMQAAWVADLMKNYW